MSKAGTELDRLLLLAEAQDCSKRAEEYFAERDKTKEKIKGRTDNINRELERLSNQINELRQKADNLAIKFRGLYQESQDAYADEDGETAKILSEEGHEVQAQCEALNDQANELRQRAKELQEERKRIFAEAESWHQKALAEIEKAKSLRHQANELVLLPQIVLRSIPLDFQNAIIDTLKSLPAHHVSAKIIERVSYSGNYEKNPLTGKPRQAYTDFSRLGYKPVIQINKQTPEGFTEIEDLKIAVAHEVGHIVYRYFIKDEQKADWATSFRHKKDDSEDSFAQCYALYYLRKEWLAEEHAMVKQFFDQLNL